MLDVHRVKIREQTVLKPHVSGAYVTCPLSRDENNGLYTQGIGGVPPGRVNRGWYVSMQRAGRSN